MAFIFITLSICLCLSYYFYARKSFSYWKNKGVPFLKPNIVFGNVLQIAKGFFTIGRRNSVDYYSDVFRDERYFGLYFFLGHSLVLKDPELIKSVLVSNFDSFTDRHNFNSDYDIFVQNLPVLNGIKWKNLRRKLTPIFTMNSMKRMFPLFLEQAEEMSKHINENELNTDISSIQHIAENYVMDVLASVVLGLSLKKDRKEFQDVVISLTQYNIKHLLRLYLKYSLEPLANLFRVSLIPAKAANFFLNVSKEVIRARKASSFKRHDLIDLLLELEENEDGFEVNHEFVASQVFSFIVPGFETTATALMVITHELAHNHDIQETLSEEIRNVLDKHSGNISYEALSNMPYMDAVIDEGLRKYPFFSYIPKMCTRTIRLPDTDFTIEKNTHVLIPIGNIHHDPLYYPEPDKFDPERFLNQNTSKRNNMTYLPFGGGPRCCIAVRFATLQLKIALVTILRDFKVDKCAKSRYPLPLEAPMSLIKPKRGVWVKFTERSEKITKPKF